MNLNKKRTGFVSPVKQQLDTKDQNNKKKDKAESNHLNNNKIEISFKSGFKSPVKITTNSTTTTTVSPSKVKSNIPKEEIFTHKPDLEKNNTTNENDESVDRETKEIINKQKEILSIIYSKNEPFTAKQLKIDSSNQLALSKLLDKRMVIEIKLDNQITLYSSVQWYKVTSLLLRNYYFDKQVKETEAAAVQVSSPIKSNEKKSKDKNINDNSNNSSNQQTTPQKENHLSKTFKRKSITPIKLNLGATTVSTSDDTPKKLKVNHKHVDIYPLEAEVDDEISQLEDERKRLINSINAKKEQLQSFTNKTKPSPIEESKKHAIGSNKDGNIDKLMVKWKRAAKIAVQKLQDAYMLALKKQEEDGLISLDPKQAAERRKRAALQLAGFKSSKSWDDNQSYDDNDDSEGSSNRQRNHSEFQTDQDTSFDDQDNILDEVDVTSKLYIMKLFRLEPKELDYDEESDSFK